MLLLARIAIFVILVAAFSPIAWGKGVTVEIAISGGGLSEPFSVTDPEIVAHFTIWSGPNSRSRVRGGPWRTDYSKTFIDFPFGSVESPSSDHAQYVIEFHIASSLSDKPERETYKVRYAFDSSQPGGYMYLPNRNPFISHGVEGNWFRSTESWERLVRPVILGNQ